MRHIVLVVLAGLTLANRAAAQDLKVIQRDSAEIQMFASTACDNADSPTANDKLAATDNARLTFLETDLSQQLTTLKAQTKTLAQLGISTSHTPTLDAEIKALAGKSSLCTLAQAFAAAATAEPMASSRASSSAPSKPSPISVSTSDPLVANPTALLFDKTEVGTGRTIASADANGATVGVTQDVTLAAAGDYIVGNAKVELCEQNVTKCDPLRAREYTLTKIKDCAGTLTNKSGCKVSITFNPIYSGRSKALLHVSYDEIVAAKEKSPAITTSHTLDVPLFGEGFVDNIAELNGDGISSGNPSVRAVAGFNLSGASSTDVSQNYFLEFDLNVPMGGSSRVCEQRAQTESGRQAMEAARNLDATAKDTAYRNALTYSSPDVHTGVYRHIRFSRQCGLDEWDRGTQTDPLNRRAWWFFNPRIAGVPGQQNPLSNLTLQSPSDLFSGQQAKLVAGIEVIGGVEFALIKPRNGLPFWSSYKNTRAKLGLSAVAGGGFKSPFSAGNTNPPVFQLDTTNTTLVQQLQTIDPKDFGTDPTKVLMSLACSPNSSSGACAHSNFAFVNLDRSRFFRSYFIGLRLKSYHFSDLVSSHSCDADDTTTQSDEGNSGKYKLCEGVYNAFPGIVDLTVGQDESVTAGHLSHFVFRLDAVYPLPWFKGFTIFGSLNAALESNRSTAHLFAPPSTTTGVTVSDKSVFQVPLTLPDRDNYRVGLGVDLVQLAHSINAKQAPAPQKTTDTAGSASGSQAMGTPVDKPAK